jgi:hypothetical protein
MPHTPPRPDAALTSALPTPDHLIEEMSTALVPATNRDHAARDAHGVSDGYAATA